MKCGYSFYRAFSRIRSNILISILIVAQVTIGISAFIYSSNLLFSMKEETEYRENQVRDLLLEITVDDSQTRSTIPITLGDLYEIQNLSNDTAFIYIDIPQFIPYDDTFYEFHLVAIDYSALDLNNSQAYWEPEISVPQEVLNSVIPKGISLKVMPKTLETNVINNGEKEVAFSECIIIPIEYMEDYIAEISSAGIHVEWSADLLPNKELTIRKIESYLSNTHNGGFRYRIISPEVELDSFRFKTDRSIKTIESGSILFICMYCIGQLSAFQVMFERRKRSYGICLAAGAEKSQLGFEISIEIIVINSVGLLLGSVLGIVATTKLDLGIMPGDILTRICPQSFLLELVLVFATILITIISVCNRLGSNHVLSMIRD
ncbi:MAG: hypothetical protein KBS56_02210 [Clostridiales bacterium]|nr:hypothetical protein [Candidatus Crickella equi]